MSTASIVRGANATGAVQLQTVTVDEFASVEEPGADAQLGTTDEALIPEGGALVMYGDGGAGKTTLGVDLAFHLAAGDDWLGVTVPQPLRVLIIENEGPRPFYRRKLARKRAAWTGSEIDGRIRVLEHPWARLSFADPTCRQLLAGEIRKQEIDIVIAGPITSLGMDAPGTIQEVRDFDALLEKIRDLAGRRVSFFLIHHENRAGRPSGAWEGVGDTLLHVTQQGHGRLRLHVQKARWASERHATTMHLVWAEGDGFALGEQEPDRPERTWDGIAAYVLAHGGCGWVNVEKAVSGQGDYLRRRRDSMLDEGVIINAGTPQKFELWHCDDPARPLDMADVSEGGHDSDTKMSTLGDGAETDAVSPCPPVKGDTGGDTVGSASPAESSAADALDEGRT